LIDLFLTFTILQQIKEEILSEKVKLKGTLKTIFCLNLMNELILKNLELI